MVHEEQVLQFLQDIQLGLRHDVYPVVFVRKTYTWSLLALSIALLVRWEITFFLHPERFSEETNDYLQCRNCTEKLCVHKKQLNRLWKQIEEYSSKRIRQLRKQ